MEGRVVSICGFPKSYGTFMLRSFIENHTGQNTVEDVERKKDCATFTFHDETALHRLQESKIREVLLDGKTYKLKIMKTSRKKKSARKEPTNRDRKTKSPLPTYQAQKQETSFEVKEKEIPIIAEETPEPSFKMIKIDHEFQQTENIQSMEHWHSLDRLPAGPGTRCLLVQNIDPSTYIENIKMHFESRKRSNGGPVLAVRKIIDGTLVIFKDEKCCDSSLQKTDQIFAGKTLVIYPKLIPEYYGNKFIIKGVSDHTSVETLYLFLEACSNDEATPESCQKQTVPGVYVIEYGEEFDTSETDQLLRNICRKTLENHSLTAERLLKTDCLKVSNVPPKASTDAIRLVLESKKRTGGGPVTRIDWMESGSVLVYFASYEDAERVSLLETIVIQTRPVTVKLYFHSLSKEHENVLNTLPVTVLEEDSHLNGPPTKFRYCHDDISRKLIKFIWEKKKHEEKLRNHFCDLAVIKICSDEMEISVYFSPLENENVFESQQLFILECNGKLCDYLSHYATECRKFDENELDVAKRLDFEQILVEEDVDNDDVYVGWSEDDESLLKLTGTKETVKHVFEIINRRFENVAEDLSVTEQQYRIITSCGILSELKEKFQNIDVQCDKKTKSISITGQKQDVSSVQAEVLNILESVETRKLEGIEDHVITFLIEGLKKSSEIQSNIQKKFKKINIQAMLDIEDGYPCIHSRTEGEYSKAQDALKELVKSDESIKVDDGISKIVSYSNWKHFLKTLKGAGLYKVCVESRNCISIIGLTSEMNYVKRKINTFLKENAIDRVIVPASYGNSRYATELSDIFSTENCKKMAMEYGLTSEEGGGIYFDVKKIFSKQIKKKLDTLLKCMVQEKQALNIPGIKEYFETDSGRIFFKTTEQDTNCIILMSSPLCQERFQEYNKSTKPTSNQDKAVDVEVKAEYEDIPCDAPNCSNSDKEKIASSIGPFTVSIVPGDITLEESDVIINSSNIKFDLNGGQVGKTILKIGGREIQTELYNASGNEYRLTSGGNLHCEKIIHMVTPGYVGGIKKILLNILREIETLKFSSVSIPAIGTGKIGLDVSSVASTMRESFEEYTASNPITEHLKIIKIVVYEPLMLQDFKTIMLDSKPAASVEEQVLSPEVHGPDVEDIIDEALDLYFYSTKPENIAKAWECIYDEANKVTLTKVISDETIGRITDWERLEIKQIASENQVKITDLSNRYLKRYRIQGLADKVLKSHEAVKDILKDFSAAETTASFVMWQKLTQSKEWVNYPPRATHVLEKAYKAWILDRQNTNIVKIQEYEQGSVVDSEVDLSWMEQDEPLIRRKVKESCKIPDEIPSFWDDMLGEPLKTVDVGQGTEEYDETVTTFKASGKFYSKIISLKRIQSEFLYKQYMAKKKEVTKKLENSGVRIERQLFHGTVDDEKIILHGFDRSYAGKNATAYGRGVYFAKNASYSHTYAKPNSKGERRIFIADVITGDCCQGNSKLVAPPPRTSSGIKNDLYDSVVDRVTDPTIFVIFKDASAYPTYLITYS